MNDTVLTLNFSINRHRRSIGRLSRGSLLVVPAAGPSTADIHAYVDHGDFGSHGLALLIILPGTYRLL